jgi:hypothetical protein
VEKRNMSFLARNRSPVSWPSSPYPVAIPTEGIIKEREEKNKEYNEGCREGKGGNECRREVTDSLA